MVWGSAPPLWQVGNNSKVFPLRGMLGSPIAAALNSKESTAVRSTTKLDSDLWATCTALRFWSPNTLSTWCGCLQLVSALLFVQQRCPQLLTLKQKNQAILRVLMPEISLPTSITPNPSARPHKSTLPHALPKEQERSSHSKRRFAAICLVIARKESQHTASAAVGWYVSKSTIPTHHPAQISIIFLLRSPNQIRVANEWTDAYQAIRIRISLLAACRSCAIVILLLRSSLLVFPTVLCFSAD